MSNRILTQIPAQSTLEYYIIITSMQLTLRFWHPGGFGDFRKKKRLNARGFALEFLRSGMLYRPGKCLKRRGKSSSLH